MAHNLADLSKELRDFARGLPDAVNEIKKDVANTILTNLSATTPVDTGVAMSNWMVTTGSSSQIVREAHVPSPKGHRVDGQWTHRVPPEETRDANLGGVIEDGSNEIEMAKAGEAIYITNNLPYIQKLEDGFSPQAELFVEAAISAGSEVAKGSTL